MSANTVPLPPSPYFTLNQVGDGVFAAIVAPGAGAWGNAGIVDLGDRTLVFDTFFTPLAAQALRSAAEQLTGHTVVYVVNSHMHVDHVMGNQVFADATIIATEQTRASMTTRIPAMLAEGPDSLAQYIQSLGTERDQAADERQRADLARIMADWSAFHAALPTLVLTLPNMTFTSPMQLHGSQRRAELITYGGGHTPSDAFLYLPDDRLAFMGDLGQVGFHPWIGNGNPEQWVSILQQVEELAIDTMVGGHGVVGSLEDTALIRQYITDLLKLARDAKQQGVTAAQVDQIEIPVAYEQWQASGVFGQNMEFLLGREEL